MGLEAATLISQLNASNPVGGDAEGQGDDHLRMIKTVLQTTFPGTSLPFYLATAPINLASAASTDIGAQLAQFVNITGAVTITGLGTAGAGVWRVIRFTGSPAPLLVHNATSLILPGAASIQASQGDMFFAYSLGSGNWVVPFYQKASGLPTVSPTLPNVWTTIATGAIVSQATLDVGSFGTYDELELLLMGIVPSVNTADIALRFSQSAVFLVGASDYHWGNSGGGNGFNFGAGDAGAAEIELLNSLGTGANETCSLKIRVLRPTAVGFPKHIIWEGGIRNSAGTPFTSNGWGGLIANTNAIDGLRVFPDVGLLASGFYSFKGLKW